MLDRLIEAFITVESSREEVLKAVSLRGDSLQGAAPCFCDDEEVVMAAVNESGKAMEHASERLRGDKEFALLLVEKVSGSDWMNLVFWLSDGLRGDREVARAVLSKACWTMKWLSNEIRSDSELLGLAVKGYVEDMPLDLRKTLAKLPLPSKVECTMEGISDFIWKGDWLHFANDELRDNEKFVMECVSMNGVLLQYASERLRCSPRVVLAAVRHGGAGLWCASERLVKECMIYVGEKDIDLVLGHQVVSFLEERVYNDEAKRQNAVFAEVLSKRVGGKFGKV